MVKEFLEAGKRRLAGDTARAATWATWEAIARWDEDGQRRLGEIELRLISLLAKTLRSFAPSSTKAASHRCRSWLTQILTRYAAYYNGLHHHYCRI